MERGKNVAAQHSELRLEGSPAAIGSDICHCCGNNKRGSLLPASSSRKRLSMMPPAPPIRKFFCGEPLRPMSPPAMHARTQNPQAAPHPITPSPIASAMPIAPTTQIPEALLMPPTTPIISATPLLPTTPMNPTMALPPVRSQVGERRLQLQCPCGVVRKIRLFP